MRHTLQLVLLCAAVAGLSAGQVVIDRLVATVNGQPILQSDWDAALRCEAFLDQKPLEFTPEAARGALERLIDQELLRQQIRTFQLKPIGEDELRLRMQALRRQIPGATDEAAWQAALHRYGLTQGELEERFTDQMEILRFIDVRLRPTVHVDRRSIEAYYRDKLLPEIRQKGGREVPLVEVSPQIEEILLQQRMDEQLTDLLRDLRQQSEIHIQSSALPPGDAQPAQQARKPGLPAPAEVR